MPPSAPNTANYVAVRQREIVSVGPKARVPVDPSHVSVTLESRNIRKRLGRQVFKIHKTEVLS